MIEPYKRAIQAATDFQESLLRIQIFSSDSEEKIKQHIFQEAHTSTKSSQEIADETYDRVSLETYKEALKPYSASMMQHEEEIEEIKRKIFQIFGISPKELGDIK